MAASGPAIPGIGKDDLDRNEPGNEVWTEGRDFL